MGEDTPSLADAINADRGGRGERVSDWAARNGVPVRIVEQWLLRPPKGHTARLLAMHILRDAGIERV